MFRRQGLCRWSSGNFLTYFTPTRKIVGGSLKYFTGGAFNLQQG